MPERQSTDDNNPFAPPPEGRPDQPWQPRRPEGQDDDASGAPDPSGPSDGRWSPRQPGPSQDGFGRGPERQGGQDGPGQGGSGRGPGLRWDPKDPAQRRARYAILAGMWGFFFALFEIPELALLLGALGLYWAISSLRTKPEQDGPRAVDGTGGEAGAVSPTSQPASQSSGRTPGQGASPATAPLRAMRTAAISGLVASSVALAIVAGAFTMQLVYRDFYECRDDALTQAGRLACNDLLPKPLRAGFGVRE
ncbi:MULTISPECIES: hypothetical protein [unclassified Streptomyces]|uniref:hypothetical protein n=1 Tax=unclassified Streptomyces TaxID=2593676 RepID=UPI0006ADDB63|nr:MULTISPECIES: hypothetical protein [unclassified Streptomyces]KOX17208.1 membrane protein [Streptomyces sp. NRRL F-6491]KOX49962.1 membrane protein [Streptomyces sp. NRRL F-6492]